MYLGAGTYAELEAHTEIIQYEILRVGDLLPVEMNVNEVAVGTLSANETNTLILHMSNSKASQNPLPSLN